MLGNLNLLKFAEKMKILSRPEILNDFKSPLDQILVQEFIEKPKVAG